MSDAHPPLRSYGRLKTRTIKPRQAALMETLLPALRPPAGPFDLRTLKPDAAEVWLEIGFGALGSKGPAGGRRAGSRVSISAAWRGKMMRDFRRQYERSSG